MFCFFVADSSFTMNNQSRIQAVSDVLWTAFRHDRATNNAVIHKQLIDMYEMAQKAMAEREIPDEVHMTMKRINMTVIRHAQISSKYFETGSVNPWFLKSIELCVLVGNGDWASALTLIKDDRVNVSICNDLPLWLCAKYQNTNVIEALLKRRANPACAFQRSCKYGHAKIVKLFLKKSSVSQSALNAGFRTACSHGHSNVVQVILKHSDLDPSQNENLAIREASFDGNTELVRILLGDSRVDPSAHGNFALMFATKLGHRKIVNLLSKDRRTKRLVPLLRVSADAN